MERFKVGTPQVSAWLFTQWQLNPISSDAVLFINEPLSQIQEELDHVKILYTANRLAKEAPDEVLEALGDLFQTSSLRLGQLAARSLEETETMAKSLGISPDGTGDAAAGRKIAMEIKDLSLFFGTMTTMVAASDDAALLDAVQKGLEILFQAPRVFFFLKDREKKMMTGVCHPDDRHHSIVRSIAIPLDNQDSLVAGAALEKAVKNSFDQNTLAVSDAQIIRLMASPGLYCIPIIARGIALGTMALGVDKDLAGTLDQNRGILDLFSSQTGVCLENLAFHRSYASDVNDKKMEAYAALTDKVIHEVNNPIAIIKSYLETLSLKLPDKHPAQEELSLIGEEIFRVSTLLDGLSSFSRPKVGGLETIDINQTCLRVMAVLKKSILLPRNIQAHVDPDKGIPAVRMDGNGLKQVLINLVKNAAEAMETGGDIHITTALIPGSSKVVIDEKKKLPGWVEIRIKDSGPGIADHIRERLFEPYNTSKSGNNSGLGLAIVHSIVKEMKGRITCESQVGQGTCFCVYLPTIPDKTAGSGADNDRA
jgi:signal transduction histidine kinase